MSVNSLTDLSNRVTVKVVKAQGRRNILTLNISMAADIHSREDCEQDNQHKNNDEDALTLYQSLLQAELVFSLGQCL